MRILILGGGTFVGRALVDAARAHGHAVTTLTRSSAPPGADDGSVEALHADRIITMGCDVEGVPRIDDDWGLPDPKGQPVERVREIRDEVKAKAHALADELLARNPSRSSPGGGS